MFRYLLKQPCREFKAFLINQIIGFITIGIFLVGFIFAVLEGLKSSEFIINDNIFKIGIGLVFYKLGTILFMKDPPFKMHPASIQYFYNSAQFSKIKAMVLIKKMAIKLIVSVAFCLIIYQLEFSVSMILATFSLFLYLAVCSFIRWIKYNKKSAGIVSLFYIVSSILFVLYFVWQQILALFFLMIMLIFIIIYSNQMLIDIGAYYDDAAYAQKMNHAGIHNNMAQMQQLTDEHLSNKRHKVKIYDLKIFKRKPLVAKAIIETMRMSTQFVIILLVLSAFAIVLNTTSIFINVPFLGDKVFVKIAGGYCVGMLLCAIKQIYVKQILSICDKQKQGVFIPYSFSDISKSYGSICILITFFILMIFSILLSTSIIKVILAIVLSSAIMIFSLVSIDNQKYYKTKDTMSSCALIVVSLLLF